MIYKSVEIKNNTSQEYAHMDLYALDVCPEMPTSQKRPLVLICPGGAYGWTSHREGEPVAMKYLAAGIHAAVLWYSVKPAVFPTALLEVAAAIKYLRENADELGIDKDKIMVSGFSAGGHLAASYGCFWNYDFVKHALKISEKDSGIIKPNGLILCYPVITSGEKAHEGSIINLMGENEAILATEAVRELTHDCSPTWELFRDALALEKQVNKTTPRTFIWHTQTDESVPVENTLYFINALQEQGINYEAHIYPVGGHGLSLGNEITLGNGRKECVPEVQGWIDDAIRWVK